MTTSTLSSVQCRPRYATPRTEARPTLGDGVAQVAERMGHPLMPWQRQVVDTALEVDPVTGRRVYREILVTVPRQAGKSTLLGALLTHRCITEPGAKVVYTAQTRLDARRKWEEDHLATLLHSPFAAQFTPRMQNGQEAIRWKNGSVWSITSTTEKAAHGMTLTDAFIDEAFSQEDNRLEQAFKPAMATKPDAQLWIVSTAGTPKSHYLNAKIDAGRQAVKDGITSGVAYFEWSADPDDDLDDPKTWWTFHPALGHTINEEVIAADKVSMDPMEWRRAYANIRTDHEQHIQVLDPDKWLACFDADSAPLDPVTIAVDVSPARASATVAVAGARADGMVHTEVVDYRTGLSWVVPRVVQLVAEWGPAMVVVDPAGPAGSLIPELAEHNITARVVRARDVGQACGAFYDLVDQGRLRHLGQPPLEAAVAGAKRRPIGDLWAWHRKDVTVDITPLVAVTLAAWGWQQSKIADPDAEVPDLW
jgi:phage terminase large subunit-like protein